jgi:CheY-specific phosphatase CheX
MPELQTAPSDTFPPIIGDAVRDAAADFFKSSCNLKYQEHPESEEEAPASGMMSTISFLGDQPWSFSLLLPDETAVALAKAFAGFEIPADSADMGDVIGEVVNVIAGGICARLDARGIKAQMSLPTVVRGANVSVLVPSGALTKRMGFTGPNGTCWLRLVKARRLGSTRQSGS